MLLFASFFLRDPRVLATFAIATLVLTAIVYRCRLRPGRFRFLTALGSGASLGLIVAFTWPITSANLASLNPDQWAINGAWERFNPADGGFGSWSHGTDGPLNVLLYVPAGLAITTVIPALRRTWAAPVALALTSVLTEVWQALDGGRVGQLSDITANTLGALIGTTAALLIRLAHRRHANQRVHRQAESHTPD